VALLVIVALAAAAGWWLAIGRFTHVPGVIGRSRSAATSQLRAAGLHLRVLPAEHSATVATGLVASESPGPGGRIHHGGTVSVRLSLGPVHHAVPELAGETVSTSTVDLRQLGFVVATASKGRYSDTIGKGDVVATAPAAGASIAEGRTVHLILSRGPAPVPVPDVAGMNVDDATQALMKAGLTIGNTTQRYSAQVPNGDVVATSPPAGVKVRHGSTVDLVLSKGPQLFPVPDVNGENINQAVHDINAAGFVAKPRQAFPGGPGQVFRESPSGQQPKGTTIELDYF
jgi:serine/threonine-protein kinase